MAVPARPVSGAPIDSTWGGIAHDTAVAQDLQYGVVVITTAGSPAQGSTTITFPRPFSAAPVVMLSINGTGTDQPMVAIDNVTTTGCRLNLRAAAAFGYTGRWFAIGPRA